MKTEIEAKFINIDTDNIRKKLSEIGAKLIKAEVLMKRCNFDYGDGRLEKIGGWIRVRDEGNRATLTYKQLNDRTLHGTKEIETEVSDFNATVDLLKAIGLVSKSYQETKREIWAIKNSEIAIDTWPWVKTFIEIESPSESEVKEVANMLGFNWADAMFGSVENVYQSEYNVTESEVDSWPTITFTDVPKWLEDRRKS